MTQSEKIGILADMFEVDASEITPETALKDLNWDSMAMITLMALVSEHCSRRLTGEDVRGLKTISDVLKMME